jgi:CheY-like chemotaxis protein
MKCLIVEDDFASRMILQRFLMPYGETEIAKDGNEAIAAFQRSVAVHGLTWSVSISCCGVNGQTVLQRSLRKPRPLLRRRKPPRRHDDRDQRQKPSWMSFSIAMRTW